jgi:sigma-54 dependent transcriptional regulator, acetoin dehydrogenase operon transcriptional activator AcoR
LATRRVEGEEPADAVESTSTMRDWRHDRGERTGVDRAGLVILYAEEHGQLSSTFPFDTDVVLAGREAEASTIVIPQKAVSRVHARFAREDTSWTLRDLDSRNGIVVNGRKIREVCLSEGDEVRIGDALFKFVARGIDEFAPYRLDRVAAVQSEVVGGLAMARVSAELATLARSDLPVLIIGETGTGKELAARAVHAETRRDGPMRAINCAAIPANLVESELFGHKKGAFSGATADSVGVLRSADGGTLLLDEIGDMPLEAQAKLLRVLETREVVPVGSVRGDIVDVRIVAATHRDLRACVDAGTFRGDLFARLNGSMIRLPPLRERKEDVFPLVRHFLAAAGAPTRHVTFGFMLSLLHYDWPFNVRELQGVVKRAVALAGSAVLDARQLPETIVGAMTSYGEPADDEGTPARPPTAREPRPLDATLERLLVAHHGNVSAVARELGKDRALVNRWIRAAGFQLESYRR